VAWSDQFTNGFDFIRTALEPPLAGGATSSRDPAQSPITNFVAMRVLAQIVGQRVQSQLLLDQPEAALRDLTLLWKVPCLFGNQPTSLVHAMIEVAIHGIYLDAIADGLRLHVWREPELVTIQEQLQDLDLLSLMLKASCDERSAACRILESGNFRDMIATASFLVRFEPPSAAEQRWQDLKCWGLSLIPSGWLYQNMAEMTKLEQRIIQSVEPSSRRLSPAKLESASQDFKKMYRRRTPDNFLVSLVSFDQSRAWRTVAWRQTEIHEALLACALERARLVTGNYPASLSFLVPRFILHLPHDLFDGRPLRYRRTERDHFLLYSVGWNERDDGGVGVSRPDGQPEFESKAGDWVWPG
jgi:hypothetical protein